MLKIIHVEQAREADRFLYMRAIIYHIANWKRYIDVVFWSFF